MPRPTRCVAFLRAINVGGRNVKAPELIRVFARAGLADVTTFLASGNVIFTAPGAAGPRLEGKLAAALEAALGYPVPVFVRSGPELVAVAAHEPFPPAMVQEARAIHVLFLAQPATPAFTRGLTAYRNAEDEFHVRGREAWWLCRTRITESPFGKAPAERRLGVTWTARNRNTVVRLVERYGLDGQGRT